MLYRRLFDCSHVEIEIIKPNFVGAIALTGDLQEEAKNQEALVWDMSQSLQHSIDSNVVGRDAIEHLGESYYEAKRFVWRNYKVGGNLYFYLGTGCFFCHSSLANNKKTESIHFVLSITMVYQGLRDQPNGEVLMLANQRRQKAQMFHVTGGANLTQDRSGRMLSSMQTACQRNE